MKLREASGGRSTLKGKVMFVCSKREIAYAFWLELVALRPEWNEVLA
ncbi:hypothetical protein [endosymbiont of Lamellibrachia barhami]|nr:hypothetical protein [endosymbiont of Lamellibrachia barhami]